MNKPTFQTILLPLFVLLAFLSPAALSFTPPEVATGTFSCVAKWNELCEDTQSISVPEGYKLCSHDIKVVESAGSNSHGIVAIDDTSLTIKFSAKGNLDRIRQKDSTIELAISLRGVRKEAECKPKPKPKVVKVGPPKIHACACPQLIEAENVSKCLAKGEGKYGVKCELDTVDLKCFASKDECREYHRKNCDAVVGIDKSKSKKRLFIENSPLCTQ